MRAAVVLLLAAAVAGCVTPAGSGPSACPPPGGVEVVGPGGALPSTADPRQPADALYVVRGLDPARSPNVTLATTDGSGVALGDGAPVPAGRLTFNGTDPRQRLERLRLAPRVLERGLAVSWRVRNAVPAGCEPDAGGLVHGLAARLEEGTLLRPGQGAHVWYAGFWENGTMFETNIEAFDQGPWPKAGWYQRIPYEPIPVYVYDRSPSEQPAHWQPPAGAVGRTGTPVDGPAGAASAATGVGYHATIKGFNDGLKGLSTTGTRVVWMAAADAYPEGSPSNPLAGDNLVFLVRLERVVDQPCPSPPGAGTLPCQLAG